MAAKTGVTKKTGSTSPKRSRKPAAPAVPAVPIGGAATHEAIARRAHQLFVQRGCGHGHDLEDWLLAERELAPARGETEQPPSGVPQAASPPPATR
jgi:hypothetical protein